MGKKDKWRSRPARERVRRAECHGKEVFETFWQAWRVAQRLAKRHHREKMHPYSCRWCCRWHIGPTEEKQPKPRGSWVDRLDREC